MQVSVTLQSPFLRRCFSYCRSILVGIPNAQYISASPQFAVPTVYLPPIEPFLPPQSEKSIFQQKITQNNNNIYFDIKSEWLGDAGKLPLQKLLLGCFFLTVSVAIATVIFLPTLYYTIFPETTVPVIAKEAGTPLGGNYNQGPQATIPLPPVDPTLPDGNWLIIPRIHVRTELLQTTNAEDALAKGVWWVPDFGQPGDMSKPMIVAAHRYGYKWWWNTNYWQYHSFYLLPTLQPGDFVEVISNHRKFVYEIYAGAEGEEITDYHANLILYTCKFLNSPVRHFRYARLIDPTKNTQGPIGQDNLTKKAAT